MQVLQEGVTNEHKLLVLQLCDSANQHTLLLGPNPAASYRYKTVVFATGAKWHKQALVTHRSDARKYNSAVVPIGAILYQSGHEPFLTGANRYHLVPAGIGAISQLLLRVLSCAS